MVRLFVVAGATLLFAGPAFAQAGNPNSAPWNMPSASGEFQRNLDSQTMRERSFKRRGYTLSNAEETALSAFEKALDKPNADQAMIAAEAAAQGPDARFVLGALERRLADKRNDAALREKANDHMIASGRTPKEALPGLYREQGLAALNRNDNGKAEVAFGHLVELTPGVAETRVILGQVRANEGKNGAALAMFDEAIAIKTKAREPVPAVWLDVANRLRASTKAR